RISLRLLHIKFHLLVQRREGGRKRSYAFRWSEQENACGLQRVMNHRQSSSLQHRLEVDQHVTTADQIEIAEGRIRGDVLRSEDAGLADGFVDLVPAVHFDEKAFQTFRRNAGEGGHIIGSRTGLLNRRLADIRGEYLN